MSDNAWREAKMKKLKQSVEQHLVWFGLARLNYMSASGQWMDKDDARHQRKSNIRAMAKRIVQHDRALIAAEGYRQ